MSKGAKKEVAAMVGYPVGPAVEEYLHKPIFDQDGVQATSGIGFDGREYPDPVPMSPPAGYEPPSDILQMLETLFRRGKAVLEAAQVETEEEANDFDCEDDPVDELTPYEAVFNPPAAPPAAPAPGPAAAASAPVPSRTEGPEGGAQPTGAPPKAPAPVAPSS
jgi:hypothetical protein